MPLFNWQANSSGEIIGPHFWVYWAFAIPLTGLVIGMWGVWIGLILRRHGKEDQEVRERSLRTLLYGKGIA